MKSIEGRVRKAIEQYNMIEDGDKIAIGLSGGKDSLVLLYLMANLKRYYPKKFDLVAITIDMFNGKSDFSKITEFCNKLGVEHKIIQTRIYDILFEVRKESNPCSLCSKMRRGALCTVAKAHGYNSIALGHHADDLIETYFLSMFYEGRLSTFMPVTHMSRTDMKVIRPMIFIEEKDVVAYSKDKPVLHNPCPEDKTTQRQYIKDLLNSIKKDIPFVKKRIHSAITNPERYNLFPLKED